MQRRLVCICHFSIGLITLKNVYSKRFYIFTIDKIPWHRYKRMKFFIKFPKVHNVNSCRIFPSCICTMYVQHFVTRDSLLLDRWTCFYECSKGKNSNSVIYWAALYLVTLLLFLSTSVQYYSIILINIRLR